MYGLDAEECAFCLVGDEQKTFRDYELRLGFTGGQVPMGNGAYNSFLVGLPKGDFAPIPNKTSILKAEENQPVLLTLVPSLASTAGSRNCSFESKTSGEVLSFGSGSNFIHYLVDEAAFFADVVDEETLLEFDDGSFAKIKSSMISPPNTGGTTTTSGTE